MATTYEPIATTTLSSTASTINFTGIPNTYTDLVIISVIKTTGQTDMFLRLNADSGTSYAYTYFRGDGANVSASGQANSTNIRLNNGNATPVSTIPMFTAINIFSYTNAKWKTVLIDNSNDESADGEVSRTVGLYMNTSVINAINLSLASGSFASGSTVTLYGIKAA